jgi:hypothetical protein
MTRHSCITLPDDSVVINGAEYDFMAQELARLQQENAELRRELEPLKAALEAATR